MLTAFEEDHQNLRQQGRSNEVPAVILVGQQQSLIASESEHVVADGGSRIRRQLTEVKNGHA